MTEAADLLQATLQRHAQRCRVGRHPQRQLIEEMLGQAFPTLVEKATAELTGGRVSAPTLDRHHRQTCLCYRLHRHVSTELRLKEAK